MSKRAMRRVSLTFYWFMITSLLLQAQSEHVSGHVVDQRGEPIPFAHVRIDGTYSGTLTNIYGNFQLNVPSRATTKLTFSCIGFAEKTLGIPLGGSMKITLDEDLISLQEVVIVPEDYARELVLAAIEQIPENYPTQTERISGFIRETLSKDSLADRLHYISEAQTEVSKSTYARATARDDVKLIKGRKLNVDTVNLRLRIYAGAHLPHRFDYVMNRKGPLNPRKMDNYIYQVDDTVKYQGKRLFRVGYLSRDGYESGTLSILEGTHAIVSVERKESNERFKTASLIKINERQYLNTITNYDNHEDSLWRLNYIRYSTMFINDEDSIYLNSLYTSHDFQAEKEKILYAERIQYGDFLTEQVNEFDPNYWSDFNVTLPDRTFDEKYEQKPTQEPGATKDLTSIKRTLNIIQRLEFSYNVRSMNTSIAANDVGFNQGEIMVDQRIDQDDRYYWSLSSSISYRFKKKFFLKFESTRSLKRRQSADRFIGITYRQPLKKGGRVFLAGSLGYNQMVFNRSLGQVALTENTSLNGKKIDADRVDVYSTSINHSLLGSLAFLYEINRRLKFMVGVDHFTPFGGRNGLTFIEDQGIFRRREVFIEEGTENLLITSNQDYNFQRVWGLRTGLVFGF